MEMAKGKHSHRSMEWIFWRRSLRWYESVQVRRVI